MSHQAVEFGKNPFQKKYIPVLFAILVSVMCAAVDHGVHRVVPILIGLCFAAMQIQAAGVPLKRGVQLGYIAIGALFSSLAIMMVFVGAWLAFLFAAAFALFPLSVVIVRPLETPKDVQ